MLWKLTYIVETFMQGSTFVLRMNNNAKILQNAEPEKVSDHSIYNYAINEQMDKD